MQVKVEGKSNICVSVVCDSISEAGIRITTLECTYPRIIHSELKTHRMLSTNSASSRAIPFDKMVKQLDGMPVRFGAAAKGMQDSGGDLWSEINGPCFSTDEPSESWEYAKEDAVAHAKAFYEAGYAKQIYNRLLEPFQTMKTVITATCWDNFFHLRLDSAADPTIQELAMCMKEAMDKSKPKLLRAGHWHLPYVTTGEDCPEKPTQAYLIIEDDFIKVLSLEDAIKVSAARCAAVSFRNIDYGLKKCLEVYDKLVNSERIHGSALEHQATPMDEPKEVVDSFNSEWQKGISHVDRRGNFWSGNFVGWIQYRKLIPNESK